MRKQQQQQQQQHLEAVSTTSLSQSSLEEDRDNPYNNSQRISSLDRVNDVLDRNNSNHTPTHTRTQRQRRQQRQPPSDVAIALANKAFHLPGNNYFADWCQYMVNNHLLLGMCCRHRDHPISTRMRALNFLGSALFGLMMTNLIWLGYIYYDEDPDSVVFRISFQGSVRDHDMVAQGMDNNVTLVDTMVVNATRNDGNGPAFEIFLPGGPEDEQTAQVIGESLQVTTGMILLWTVGGSAHAIYDSVVWYAATCVCCTRCKSLGCMQRMGRGLIALIVLLIAVVASFAVVLRATLLSHEEIDASALSSAGLVDDAIHVGDFIAEGHGLGAFEFVTGYFVEFLLALFVYYPLFATLVFTGSLNWFGCHKVAWLGGRPYQVEQEARRNANAVANSRNFIHRSQSKRQLR